MGIFRLYTGNDGQSHIEEQTFSAHPALTTPQAAAHIVFGQMPVGTFIDWHPAPRRQYVIILAGQPEIGLADDTLILQRVIERNQSELTVVWPDV